MMKMKMDSGMGLFSSKDLPTVEGSNGKGLITQKKKKPRNYEYEIYTFYFMCDVYMIGFLAPSGAQGVEMSACLCLSVCSKSTQSSAV